MDSDKRIKLVRIASLTALIGNIIICIAKLVIGIYAQSLSVLGDGLDSATDVIISVITLAVSFIINRPSDKEHPWGHQRAETMAALILSFIIMTAGFQLFLTAAGKLINVYKGTVIIIMPHILAAIVTVSSIIVKLLLALNQYIMGKKAGSMMIQANAKNMTNDVILSSSVLTGLAISYFFNAPIFDAITALLVSAWIIKSGLGLFIELNVELMDGNTNELLYKLLFEAANSVEGAHNPHRARIRRMANLLDIDLDIEVDPSITICEGHNIAEKVTSAIKEKMENVYDVMVHIEPYGIHTHEEEGFGLSEKDIKV
ncbi:cation diffusion facilitator family transporter [Treponema putidum]|uniref:Cation transporter n=1 Tax=Treponema putidum TaxID=221027 RepID=A0AAE9SIP8_9SPIR|nr:cation diffusion facilitator family transporter [Treponema putidum]AIN93145.1 cation transporter [Treponema putidum]TWI78629.1 cation diffusion facilitator family transporter [Treponema putidum]UTY29392.1 cation transporter [Treponema putidum]UTY31882.1 cation transporter [Treponema putidum]UTY34245.1 cation transporter [Treponema putidum]